MPSDSSSGGPRKTSTRNSIRHSLNFASVGKAFADVINKESRDSDKSAKRAAKESHRSSTIGLKPLAPRASLDSRPSPPSKRSRTPDSKTITARRRSSLATAVVTQNTSVEDPSAKATPQPAVIPRPSTLRPRPGNSSGLPKYRPKSIIRENGQKPSSPGLTGARKRASISDDEKEETKEPMKRDALEGSDQKGLRPISPLPHRAAFKVNLTNLTPATPLKSKNATASVAKSSPNRLTKAAKAATTIPRPSSSSSSSSFTPRTPKDSPTRSAKESVRPAKPKSGHDSSPSSSHSTLPESPLVRHIRQRSKAETSATEIVGNMSHVSEGDSDDDEEDVEILLAPVASLAAPTPAMPRIQTTRNRQRLAPQTPSKPPMSAITEAAPSTQTPTKSDSPSFLRPNPSPNSAERIGSILSWEQLASEASRTMDVDELGKMLSDVPPPFHAGPLSPMPTGTGSMLLDVPASPILGVPETPSTYGSISQILLPNVTPSPAPPRHTLRQKGSKSDGLSSDTAIVTLLRLQLASAENTAKERLTQLQLLEEEVHNLKQMRTQDAEQLSEQVSVLEEKMRESLEERERSEEEKTAYIASLEERLRYAEAYRDQAVKEAVKEAVKNSEQAVQLSWTSTMTSQRQRIDAACLAQLATKQWEDIQERCEDELDVVKADREMLSLLLAELDLAQQQMYQTMT